MKINIIGAGLAGCEAAWQAANLGAKVTLFEQKPHHSSPAHHNPNFAELVCSNSLRADGLANAVGLLKEEMRRLNSLIMQVADQTRVPAGGALAVDRETFAEQITQKIKTHPNITVVNERITEIPALHAERCTLHIIASGPLTDGELAESITELTSSNYLHFYDAAAPIVTMESVDMSSAYKAARYDKGGADYINCPMTKDEYNAFYNALISADLAPVKGFETDAASRCFEGCMPVETMAKRGEQTLLFGPLKPVGLPNPHDGGKIPHAVVQLRQDNAAATLYNLVGFQTHLKWGEQQRVFSMIPALKNAEFVRLGVMHRNTYISSPQILDNTYKMRTRDDVYFAGQITGVEGYIESASSGLVAGLNAGRQALGQPPVIFSELTAIGALAKYVSNPNAVNFQPMNINFGLIPPLGERIKGKKEKNQAISNRALEALPEIV